ncbi:hypothetical protein [Vibrio sp. THAF190c]|uniref:hypothetical protein n=1 Tax=Vibrio sp. THAF190c TaxID=2587865 RepID=UPI00126965B9|nr:hypothetical protein [Vibrio sp. THAF190c]QFT12982.1 hypothetical protein FIV04_23865 [Vibrio sp. THAF190c]
MRYIEYLKASEKRSNELGIGSRLALNYPVAARDIDQYIDISNRELLGLLIQRFGQGYWSNSCIQLGAQSFLFFQHIGIPCELVFGEVVINGCNEYDTTIEGLLSEWNRGYSNDTMQIHVWLNIGKDLIVDPAIASRLNEHYDCSFPAHQVVVGKPEYLMNKMRLNYIPMLTGAKFLEKTCNMPLPYKGLATSV